MKKKKELKENYILPVRCINCGHEWELEIEKGLFFVKGAGSSKYTGTPLTALSRNSEGYFWDSVVYCPNCGTNNIAKK